MGRYRKACYVDRALDPLTWLDQVVRINIHPQAGAVYQMDEVRISALSPCSDTKFQSPRLCRRQSLPGIAYSHADHGQPCLLDGICCLFWTSDAAPTFRGTRVRWTKKTKINSARNYARL